MVPPLLLHSAGKSVPRSNRALQEGVLQGLLGTGSPAYVAANKMTLKVAAGASEHFFPPVLLLAAHEKPLTSL